jgi:hypothetical protein
LEFKETHTLATLAILVTTLTPLACVFLVLPNFSAKLVKPIRLLLVLVPMLISTLAIFVTPELLTMLGSAKLALTVNTWILVPKHVSLVLHNNSVLPTITLFLALELTVINLLAPTATQHTTLAKPLLPDSAWHVPCRRIVPLTILLLIALELMETKYFAQLVIKVSDPSLDCVPFVCLSNSAPLMTLTLLV